MSRVAKSLLCIVCAALLMVGCTSQHMAVDKDAQGAVRTETALSEIQALGSSPDDNCRTWYEIFVYSYCDSDHDGIGDLNGVRSKLPELQQLGISGIWLMPIHPSTSYHKYNVSDYYQIDPDYGTMEDFEALLTECDRFGINVILDLVVNHTGSEHPWFKEAVSYLQTLPNGAEPSVQECKYIDYYFFGTSDDIKGTSSQVTGTSYFYESQFSYDMPDLNLENPAVRDEIQNIMEFWIGKGVSGFRLDAAKEFFSGNTTKNVEVLRWLQQTARALDPDCYLVAEVWDTFSTISDYYESGITSIFNYPFGDANGKITSVLRGAGQASVVSTYATALEKADKAYRENNPDYIDAPFMSNHDVGRIAGFVARDVSKIKLAGAMNLFMSGSVFIYYGEEIGMIGTGNDPSKRAPMYWNAARDNGTTNLPPDCILPEEYPLGSLEEQKPDDLSVYNYYRKAIAIRNALPVISHGQTFAETPLNNGCVSAIRKSWNEETCLILYNVSTEPVHIDLTDYSQWQLVASLSVDEEQVSMDEKTLYLPAYGTAVLIPAQ